MRTRLRGKFSLFFLTLAVLIAVPAVAVIADTINSDIVGVSGNNSGPYKAGDATGPSVDYWINQQGSGCEATGGTGMSFTLKATHNVTGADLSEKVLAKVPTDSVAKPLKDASNPSNRFSLAFDQCGDIDTNNKTVAFTSTKDLAPGQIRIEVDTQTDSNGDTYGTGQASWFLNATDGLGPTVIEFAPTGTSVPVNTNVTAKFSEAMNATTISNSTFTLAGPSGSVSGPVTYDGTTNTATLNPFGSTATNLAYNTEYTATVTTGAQDVAGNALDQDSGTPGNQPKTWTFTTEPPPNTAPTDLALSPSSVAENEPSGTEVGTLSSTDPDSGDTHTYTLVAGAGSDDNSSFNIVGDKLKTAASFDYETKNSYSVRVRTTDAGGLNFENTFTIQVTNVNEAPGAPGAPSLSSGSNPNNGAFTLSWNEASDPEDDPLTYELQHKRNDQSTFTTVKANISGTSYEFGGSSGNALENEGSWTYQVRASDGTLVSSYSGPSGAIRADRTGPSITCPSNATFQLNSGGGSQNVSVSPTDPDLAGGPTGSGSGVNTTAGQLSGTVSTTTVTTPTTPKQVTFTAVDNVGNQTPKTCDFYVVYGGGFLGFQQPINGGLTPVLNTMTQAQATQAYSDDNSRVKLGSTVPVKFELRDASGAPVTNATNTRLFVSQADSKPDPGVDEVFSTSAATTGNLFRLADATTDQWIFNLSTKSGYLNPGATTPTAFTSQGTYKLSAVLDDGSSRSVNIQLVK
jgi:hypothetical protein